MGILIRRPNAAASSGDLQSYRQRLSDGDDSTFRNRSATTPYIWVYDPFSMAEIPSGRTVVALRTAQRIRQSGSYNGWPESFLRRGGTRVNGTRLFDPSISSASFYTQRGPALYTGQTRPWTEAEVNEFGSDTQRFAHQGNSWYSIADTWMEVIYSEALGSASEPFPAHSQTISTSTVNFSVQLPAPQPEQLVRAVFQVARNSAFTDDVRTFNGLYHGNTAASARASYQAVKGQASDTDLPPGVWFMRVKAQDFIGNETGWTATTSFTITHGALPVPSLTSPVPGSTLPTPYGVRSAVIDTTPQDGRAVGAQWQFSPNQNFTSGVVSWTNSTEGLLTGPGEITYNAQPDSSVTPGQNGRRVSPGDPSQYLVQGTWHGRVRTVDKWGQFSAWSAVETFTVDHKPLAQSVTPTSHRVIDQTVTPVRWVFSDPWAGDVQTAFRIRVYTSADAMIYDSGKVSSAAAQHALNIDQAYLFQTLRMTINLFDLDDQTPTAVASNFFVFSHSPAITMSVPGANEELNTGQPTFAWNPGINRPGTTQRSYELKIYNTETGALVYTSGVVSTTATTHTPNQVILRNNRAYYLTLRIEDTDGLNSTLVRNFTTNYPAPPEPQVTVDADEHRSSGYVLLDWSATPPDPFFVAWVIYRRKTGGQWERIETLTDSAASRYEDWLVPAGGEYQWSVTQIAERSGVRLESPVDEDAPAYRPLGGSYWLIMQNRSDYEFNTPLYANADDFTDDWETNEFVIKQRGRKVNVGTYLGPDGTISAVIRPRSKFTAEEQRERLRNLSLSFSAVWLKDPYGQVILVTILPPSYSRIPGTGSQEFVDVEISYKQVAY